MLNWNENIGTTDEIKLFVSTTYCILMDGIERVACEGSTAGFGAGKAAKEGPEAALMSGNYTGRVQQEASNLDMETKIIQGTWTPLCRSGIRCWCRNQRIRRPEEQTR